MSQIFELEEVLEQPEDEQKGFSINDDAVADWAVKKIAEEQAEVERLKALAEQQIAEINLKVKHVEEQAERKARFLNGCLRQYFGTVPHKETKTQESYKLLSGTLVMKKATENLTKDDDALVEYFQQNNMQEYIKTEYKPKWAKFKKELAIVDEKVINTATGEVVDVVKVEQVPESFEVKTK